MATLYHTSEGIARGDGTDLALLDLPCDLTIAELFSDPDVAVDRVPIRGRLPMSEIVICAPVPLAGKIFLLGLNYRSHIAEVGMRAPARPVGLPISASALAAPFAPIHLPAEAPGQVDYEGEIAIVVGRPCHELATGAGWAHIAGLCAANDVSARDIQESGTRDGKVVDIAAIIKAKSFPSFKPLGPGVTAAADVRGTELTITTRVNGTQRQHASTSDMIFGFADIIEAVSWQSELRCGDVILTGTPAGVGLAERQFLAPGDIVEVEVEGIGAIRNTFTTPV